MIKRKPTNAKTGSTVSKSPRNSRAQSVDLDFDFDDAPAKAGRSGKQPKADKVVKQPKADKVSLKPNAIVKGLKELNPDIGADQVNAVKLALTLINTVGAEEVLARLNADSKSVNPKTEATGKATTKVKASNKGLEFERSTKDFGYRLRDGRADPDELKEKFKANLERAKKDFAWLRVSHFNKIVTDASGKSLLIEGLRKTKGEWVFVGRTSEGKKDTILVE